MSLTKNLSLLLLKQNKTNHVKLCRPKCTISREHRCSKAPKIFSVHINRLSDYNMYGNIVKNNSFIKFPQLLNLNQWFDTKFEHNKYELKSVVEHLGGADSGHFITYRKHIWRTDKVLRTIFTNLMIFR